jgi:aryl-alcohol dehydrogenase-like predicted oxidoreductase
MTVETFELAPGYRLSRLIRGGWQLAGDHGPVERARAIADMARFIERGVITFDCADIYTGVEEMIGAFRRSHLASHGADALARMKVHTKFVPDLAALATLDKAYVARVIDRSLMRLGLERLDLVQFHWWDYEVPGWEQAALWLQELADAGKIHLVGGTNFDTPHSAAMIEAGVKLASMQVQYSLLDPRPETALAGLCARTGLKLLCYGTIAGGFITERWLGQPEPDDLSFNRSLVKYKLIIDDFGGWTLFQELLATLDRIARRHGATIMNVATRWVLDRPHVAGVIVGARYADHLDANLGVFKLKLDAADRAAIDGVLAKRQGPHGDTYTAERDRTGRHGRIMKYNLSDAKS